jgi:hypothetical protein
MGVRSPGSGLPSPSAASWLRSTMRPARSSRPPSRPRRTRRPIPGHSTPWDAPSDSPPPPIQMGMASSSAAIRMGRLPRSCRGPRSPLRWGAHRNSSRHPPHRRRQPAGQGPDRAALKHPPRSPRRRAHPRGDHDPGRGGHLPRHHVPASLQRAVCGAGGDGHQGLPAGAAGHGPRSGCTFHHGRQIALDNTVRLEAVVLQLTPSPHRRSYPRASADVVQCLDGSWRIYIGDCLVTTTPAPLDPGQLRARKRRRRAPTPRHSAGRAGWGADIFPELRQLLSRACGRSIILSP